MEVKGITQKIYFPEDQKNFKTKKQSDDKGKDKIEISNEAKVLQTQLERTKDLSEIKKKIESKFYDSDEVINKVAEKILKEIS